MAWGPSKAPFSCDGQKILHHHAPIMGCEEGRGDTKLASGPLTAISV